MRRSAGRLPLVVTMPQADAGAEMRLGGSAGVRELGSVEVRKCGSAEVRQYGGAVRQWEHATKRTPR
ncbi:hypothetical protein [Paenibacillus sp. GCM10012303]|uniref:hypothetical protein n=1 Tax=Paenibacillus sp. GCM10012303 TaxID=3317340 RepID=UPI00360F0B0D